MPSGGSLTISTSNNYSLPEGASSNGNGSAPSGWVVLEVKDTGTGMDEETRAHIFECFFTTKPAGKGTGLGLSTVYGIVCQFCGHIYVDSQEDEGTRFQIYFPVQFPTIRREDKARTAPLLMDAAERLTILLADDEPSLRAAIAEYLRGAGHYVLESQSAYDALELARSESRAIDVLLTDIVMPGLRGTELANRVQELRPDVHVIYISGYAQACRKQRSQREQHFCRSHFLWRLWRNSLNSCHGRYEATDPSARAYVSNSPIAPDRAGVFSRASARNCAVSVQINSSGQHIANPGPYLRGPKGFGGDRDSPA